MKMVSKEEAMKDFKYLKDNIGYYPVNEDRLINNVLPKLYNDTMTIKDFIIWSIKDLFFFTYYDEDATESNKEFLNTDEEALKIKKKYKIKIEFEEIFDEVYIDWR